MLSSIEQTLLKEFLAQIPYPEQALSYHELMGFMYGLAITPVTIRKKNGSPPFSLTTPKASRRKPGSRE